jgi:protein phosphatase
METRRIEHNSRSGRSASLPLSAACISDVGSVRENNEDNFHLGLDEGLFIVSDGMGGHQSGESASRIVIEILPQILLNRLKEAQARGGKIDHKALLQAAAIEMNDLVNKKARGEMGMRGMGATLALAWISDGRGTVFLANVGDSRVYYYRNQHLNQLTRDHSIVALLLQQGEITLEESRDHPARGRLYRYIGMEGEALAEVHRVRLDAGEKLLLCSDGLTDPLDDAHIQALLDENPEPLVACRALVEAANRQGSKDNITVIVIQWEGGKID